MLKVLWAAVLAACLSACPTGGECAPNPLSADQRGALRIDDVTLVWAAKEKAPPAAYAAEYSRTKSDLQQRLVLAVKRVFDDRPQGTDPTRLEIVVTDFADTNTITFFRGNVKLVRLSDGVTLASYNGMAAAHTKRDDGLIGKIIDNAMNWDDAMGVMTMRFAKLLKAKFDRK